MACDNLHSILHNIQVIRERGPLFGRASVLSGRFLNSGTCGRSLGGMQETRQDSSLEKSFIALVDSGSIFFFPINLTTWDLIPGQRMCKDWSLPTPFIPTAEFISIRLLAHDFSKKPSGDMTEILRNISVIIVHGS